MKCFDRQPREWVDLYAHFSIRIAQIPVFFRLGYRRLVNYGDFRNTCDPVEVSCGMGSMDIVTYGAGIGLGSPNFWGQKC